MGRYRSYTPVSSHLDQLPVVAALERHPETDTIMSNISPVYSGKEFTQRVAASVNIASVITKDRHSKVTPEELSRKLGIGLETAKRTVEVTTQYGVRTALHPLHKRYRVDHLHLNRHRLNSQWYSDTLFSKVQSLRGMKCAQVYTDGKFTRVYPMESRKQVGQTLTDITDDIGVPDMLIVA